MIPHIPEELSTKIDRIPFAIMSDTMPPRDPNGDKPGRALRWVS
jgi:hypothetical protein